MFEKHELCEDNIQHENIYFTVTMMSIFLIFSFEQTPSFQVDKTKRLDYYQ